MRFGLTTNNRGLWFDASLFRWFSPTEMSTEFPPNDVLRNVYVCMEPGDVQPLLDLLQRLASQMYADST